MEQEEHIHPILSLGEIQSNLSDLNIVCTLEDLKKPSCARLWPIYEAFLEDLLGISPEQTLTPQFSSMELMEYPALHQDSLTFMTFYKKIQKLLLDIGIDGYQFQDFLSPEKSRVQYILSGLINFAKFREMRLQLFAECVEKGEQYTSQKESLMGSKNSLLDKVNGIRLKRTEEEPNVQELRQTNLELMSDIRQLKKQMSHLSNENDALGKHEKELTNTELHLNNLKQDCSRLNSKIVRNPEKLKLAIHDMHQSLKEDKSMVTKNEKKARELHSKIELMSLVETDIKSCIEVLETCEAEKLKSDNASKALEKEKEALDAKQNELKEVGIREQQAMRQLTNSTEKLNRLAQHQESKQQLLKLKLNQLKTEFEASQSERQLAQTKANEHEQMSLELEKKKLNLNKTMEADIDALSSDYQRLESALDMYQSGLEQSMNRFNIL